MLELEILDQVERVNRTQRGIEMKTFGGAGAVWNITAVVNTLYLAAEWIDADNFIFFGTRKHTLSTNAIAAVGGANYPLTLAHCVAELVSGQIWMQQHSNFDLYKYNIATDAWTAVLTAPTAAGQFAYGSDGTLYFKTGSDHYALINGQAIVVTAPAGVRFMTNYLGTPNKNRCFTATLSYTTGRHAIAVEDHASAVKDRLVLAHIPNMELTQESAAMAGPIFAGAGTGPVGSLYIAATAALECVVRPFCLPLYGNRDVVLLGVSERAYNTWSWAMNAVLYNTTTDTYTKLPEILWPANYGSPTAWAAPAADTTYMRAAVPVAVRNMGQYLRIWAAVPQEMRASPGFNVYLLYVDIPLIS
ncbi:MAG TPA: hypothetical protein VLL97_01710 [Acidobacteriota bacterium]|nr:hypothetical protein [Acidobacteriota bacterium]